MLGFEFWQAEMTEQAKCWLSRAAGACALGAGNHLSLLLLEEEKPESLAEAIMWARVELENARLGRDLDAPEGAGPFVLSVAQETVSYHSKRMTDPQTAKAERLFREFMAVRNQGRFTDLPSDLCTTAPVS